MTSSNFFKPPTVIKDMGEQLTQALERFKYYGHMTELINSLFFEYPTYQIFVVIKITRNHGNYPFYYLQYKRLGLDMMYVCTGSAIWKTDLVDCINDLKKLERSIRTPYFFYLNKDSLDFTIMEHIDDKVKLTELVLRES